MAILYTNRDCKELKVNLKPDVDKVYVHHLNRSFPPRGGYS